MQRVCEAYPYFDKGQLALLHPDPSHRLVQGVGFYARMLNAIECKQIERENERARAENAQRAGRGKLVAQG